MRDNLLQIAATKISAGVSTGIGTHSKQEREGDEQFEIDDNRSVDEVFNSIKKAGMYKNFVCVTDRKISRAPFLQQIETICALRPKALILREKDLTEAEYTQLAQKVQAVCKNYGVKFIVHTFWRAGLALGADGAHLPLPVCAAMTAAERSLAFPYTVRKKQGRRLLWARHI